MSGHAGMGTSIPAPGFANPTRDTQQAFRALLDAMAHPARRFPLSGPDEAPPELGQAMGAVALTVLDDDCSAWLGGSIGSESAAAWLSFHTGVRLVTDATHADFVFASPDFFPSLDALRLGTDEAPHRSATVVLDVRGCSGPARFRAEGAGIDGTYPFDAPWANDEFLAGWQENRALFPRGVDLVLVDDGAISALPRSVQLIAIDPDREA